MQNSGALGCECRKTFRGPPRKGRKPAHRAGGAPGASGQGAGRTWGCPALRVRAAAPTTLGQLLRAAPSLGPRLHAHPLLHPAPRMMPGLPLSYATPAFTLTRAERPPCATHCVRALHGSRPSILTTPCQTGAPETPLAQGGPETRGAGACRDAASPSPPAQSSPHSPRVPGPCPKAIGVTVTDALTLPPQGGPVGPDRPDSPTQVCSAGKPPRRTLALHALAALTEKQPCLQ